MFLLVGFKRVWTAERMTVEDPRKGESLHENYAARSKEPTRILSPRQLPTDHVHAAPTREYQRDQSSS